MSASLVVLFPIASLAIVLLLCFVGCNFTPGSVADYADYQGTVKDTAGLVAYWPLTEASGDVAFDSGPNQFHGLYTQTQPVPYDPVNLSAAATGDILISNAAIVPGDRQQFPPNQPFSCPYFDGGYVNVPWRAFLNPQPPFTLEAWVQAHWTAQDVQNNPAYRVVVASNALSAFQGFALYATPDNYWAAVVGTGSQNIVATQPPGSNQTIVSDSLHYLVVTYDGTTLTLWVDPVDPIHESPFAQATATGFVASPSPIPLYIGVGRPDLPTPLLPFNGWIQDVAFYDVVLDGGTIQTHYLNGQGLKTT